MLFYSLLAGDCGAADFSGLYLPFILLPFSSLEWVFGYVHAASLQRLGSTYLFYYSLSLFTCICSTGNSSN